MSGIYGYIAEHFGPVAQLMKQVEENNESAEATAAFHQALVFEDDPEEIERKRLHMIEEMADVFVVMQSNIHHHSSREEFCRFVKEKTERTIKRIASGYYAKEKADQ